MPEFDKNPDWYQLTNVELIEDFDPDQYGNRWYHAKFSGDAETHMWLAKEKPNEGELYYGHFEPTKSGKKLRFKRDKEPEDQARPSGAHSPQISPRGSSKDITLGMVWKVLIGIVGVPETLEDKEKFWQLVRDHVDELMLISEKLNEQ